MNHSPYLISSSIKNESPPPPPYDEPPPPYDEPPPPPYSSPTPNNELPHPYTESECRLPSPPISTIAKDLFVKIKLDEFFLKKNSRT